MTSCDNHETATSFKIEKEEKRKKKGKNVRFKLSAKAGPKAQFCRKKRIAKIKDYIGLTFLVLV